MLTDAAARPAAALASTTCPPRALFLVPGFDHPCGVGDFTTGLVSALRQQDGDFPAVSLGPSVGSLPEASRALDGVGTVVVNLPVVSWKRVLLKPLAVLALARLRKRRVVVVLHEWAGLHPLRRHAFRPALLMADRVILFSPRIRRELEADPLVGRLAPRAVLAPLPPNLERPRSVRIIPLARELEAARRDGRFVLGAFGSIYPGKRPEALLAVAAALKARGRKPLLAMIGGFVRGVDRVEEDFRARAEALRLQDDVVVSGHVGSDEDLYGLFDQVDAFLSIFPEGLTARRSSVLAAVQSGRPVVATAPATPDEFAHHPRFRALVERGAIALVPADASPDAYAEAVLAAAARPTERTTMDVEGWWRDAAEAIRAHL